MRAASRSASRARCTADGLEHLALHGTGDGTERRPRGVRPLPRLHRRARRPGRFPVRARSFLRQQHDVIHMTGADWSASFLRRDRARRGRGLPGPAVSPHQPRRRPARARADRRPRATRPALLDGKAAHVPLPDALSRPRQRRVGHRRRLPDRGLPAAAAGEPGGLHRQRPRAAPLESGDAPPRVGPEALPRRNARGGAARRLRVRARGVVRVSAHLVSLEGQLALPARLPRRSAARSSR